MGVWIHGNSRMTRFPLMALIFFCSGSFTATLHGDTSGIIIERASGSIKLIDTTKRSITGEITGLGDLSHASAVFSIDERFAYIFGRDGGLTKVDLHEASVSKRILQAGNSIGGAISKDGRLVAVSNYEPGGVRVFDAVTLEPVLDIPAYFNNNKQRSKVVGLVDAPGRRFVFSLFDAGEIWLVDMSDIDNPSITRFKGIGRQPYDALITPDGRYYIAGLFGEDGLALLDLDDPQAGVRRILEGYGRGHKTLPTYKMPHLEGWAIAGNYAFVPAIGQHALLVADARTWSKVKSIPLYGQPVFAIARPDGKQLWVNFALPRNDTIQIIDTENLEIIKQIKPGKAVLHMEFTEKGKEVWVSVRDENLVKVYNTTSYKLVKQLNAKNPSGIFFTDRAHKIGL